MTVELITGFAGTPHISSSDAGAYNAGLVGPGDYALTTGDQLTATMSNATTFALQSGDAVLNGRHVHLTGTTTATVQSGTQGQKRNDIAALRYTRDTATNIETVQLVIIKGTATTGTPTDPTLNKGLITDGVSIHDMPLYRIPLDGITVGTLVPLFNVLKPMADVWDSLTPSKVTRFVELVRDGVKYHVDGQKCAGMVTLRIDWKSNSTESWAVGDITTLPEGWRPAVTTILRTVASNSGRPVHVHIDPNGKMTWANQGGAQEAQPFGGTITYPAAA